MSTSHDPQPAYYHTQHPAYPTQQQTVQAPDGNYYYATATGQQLYVRDPYATVQSQAMVPTAPQSALASWFDYSNTSYLKGLAVGVGATLLVANPTVQSAVVKGAVAAWGAVVGGIEEIKERIRDAKAEKSMT